MDAATEAGIPVVVVQHSSAIRSRRSSAPARTRGSCTRAQGLAVEILSDATGTLALSNGGGSVSGEELHRATLVAQGQFFADVVTTADRLERLDR